MEALSNGHWPFPEPGLEGAVLPADFMRDSMLPIAKLLPEKFGCYAVLDGQVAGMGSFKGPVMDGAIEIGYGTAPAARGRGVATAITRSLVYAGLSMGAKQVIAHTNPENNASIRVLEKSAFQSQGICFVPRDGKVLRWVFAKKGCLSSLEAMQGLAEICGRFHDGLIREAHWRDDSYVTKDGFMPIRRRGQLALLLQTQLDVPASIRLKLTGCWWVAIRAGTIIFEAGFKDWEGENVFCFDECEFAFDKLEYEILEDGLGWEECLPIAPPSPPEPY